MTSPDSNPTDDLTDDPITPGPSGLLRVATEISVAALILVGIYYLFAPAKEIELPPPLQESQIDPIIRAQIEAAGQESSASTPPAHPLALAPLPVKAPVAEATVSTHEPVIPQTDPTNETEDKTEPEDARSLVARLRNGTLTLDGDQIMHQVKEYESLGRQTDAYLLLFYAAREGNGQAAFALASLYDPNHFKPGNELLAAPDAYQAHKWYLEAEKQQLPEARKRLQRLRSNIETQAQSGDSDAQRLLLNWQ
jgi:TPR repeat protein